MNQTNQTILIFNVIGILCIIAGVYALLSGKPFNTYFFAFFIGASLLVMAFAMGKKKKHDSDKQDDHE